MNKLFNKFILVFILYSPMFLSASKPVTEYKMVVYFNNPDGTTTVQESATWRNQTKVPAVELKMHLYLNAFIDNSTRFWREGVYKDSFGQRRPDQFSRFDFRYVEINGGKDVTSRMKIDETVLTIPLVKPVKPGEEIKLNMEYTISLPIGVWRTGYAEDYYFFQGWFPKFGVFEEQGYWDCRQFHFYTEYYSDFGDYDVTINAPFNYIVGGTGEHTVSSMKGNVVEWHFTARNVIDFAWVAGRNLIRIKDKHKGIDIELLFQGNHKGAVEKYLNGLKKAIDGMSDWVGEYPFSKITLVDPHPFSGSGGMEYPMLITGGTTFYEYNVQEGNLSTESVTIHEFAHQYFYSLLATNEMKSPWMDEGFTTFIQNRILNEYAGNDRRFTSIIYNLFHAADYYMPIPETMLQGEFGELGLFLAKKPLDSWFFERDMLSSDNYSDPVFTNGQQFRTRTEYIANAYSKPGLFFEYLAREYGHESVKKLLRLYFQSYKFAHPKPEQFKKVVLESLGAVAASAFNEYFSKPGYIDYAVQGIKSKTEKPVLYNCPIRSAVNIVNNGTANLPVDIEVEFDDGSSWKWQWNPLHTGAKLFGEWDDFKELNGRFVLMREGEERNWINIYFVDLQKVKSAQV
ncbi:MAG: M1 family metallopeptidase, partial [Acidobacteria bacterium]|nr:M1 family metallopeptidase [Acidobacteriota bacterium]